MNYAIYFKEIFESKTEYRKIVLLLILFKDDKSF